MTTSRNWLGTLNNPTESAEFILKTFFDLTEAKYVCGQLEKGENGTPHI
jgi:hypothetical protein